MDLIHSNYQRDCATVETPLLDIQTVYSDADDDEVKERDGDVDFFYHFESDSDYVYVSSEDDGQSSDTLADSYQSKEFQSLPNSDDEGDSNSKIMYPQYNPTSLR